MTNPHRPKITQIPPSAFSLQRSAFLLSFFLLGSVGLLPSLAEPVRLAQVPASASSAAQQLIDEGMALFQQGSRESLELALVKFAEAMRLSQATDDKPRMVFALAASGRISGDLGNKQQTLAFYEQALSLRRAVGDRS